MSLSHLLELNADIEQFRQVRDALARASDNVQLSGLTAAAKGFFLAGLFRELGRSALVITYTNEQAERLADDLSHYGFADSELFVLPPSDALIYEEGAPDFRVIGQRLAAMDAMLRRNLPQPLLAKEGSILPHPNPLPPGEREHNPSPQPSPAGGEVEQPPQRAATTGERKAVVVIAPVNGALRRTMPPQVLRDNRLEAKVGETIEIDDFVRKLVDLGYERSEICERHGEFSQRGGIIDIYASNENEPVRIELFGDEIESIRAFDPDSQRSHGHRKHVLILPAREIILTEENAAAVSPTLRREMEEQARKLDEGGQHEEASRLREKVENDISRISNLAYFDGIENYLPYVYPKEQSILDYLPPDALVILDEPHQIESQWEQLEQEMLDVLINRARRGLLLASIRNQHVPLKTAVKKAEKDWPVFSMTTLERALPFAKPKAAFQIETSPMETFAGQIEMFVDQIKTWVGNGVRVVAATSQRERLTEILDEHGVRVRPAGELESAAGPGVYVESSPLRSGYKILDVRLVVLTDAEAFGVTRAHRPRRIAREGMAISSILDLKEGDHVVHISHGIGVYGGMHTMQVDGVSRDYLLLEYAGDDRLYVPAEQIDRVQKYIGGEDNPPFVHKIGGSEWQRTTKRVRQAVREMAKELIELYAWRQALGGHPFSPDSPWQQEMEASFPYEETPDQLQAINEVKADLEQPKAMDRLICGDVGYGKTEVAIRAAFKVVNDGKQVAVLAPTTVLAQQHWNTFKERLGAFPITIEMLSRFRNRKEQKAVVEGIKLGTVDIVIGTHRILSKDMEFKDLGLIIVDEEQRFGVGHKERLKQLKKTVDALTMTATPIPRTLHMSLAGIRDMSVINDPPEGRTPVKTFVREFDDEIVREAIVRELDRGGQVYFVHNRVENIAHIAAHVAKLVPYAKIEVGHGQMADEDLERIMLDFYDRKFDVLVCTTIIESGLDIPNVNTIIVNNADKMGLAQLYQLRGRVGRSDRQAYAYLTYKKDSALTDIAEKRLEAIKEFTDLGSGFKIALRDLEIRGAGNLLGPEQHGQIVQVGFDLYCQLLSQAISELKGEAVPEVNLPPVDLPVDAFIPVNYITAEAQRVFFYKKMASAKIEKEVQAIQDELEDRFGDPPRQVWNMLALLRMRIRAAEIGIASVGTEKRQIVIRFAPGYRLTPDVTRDLSRQHRRHWFQADHVRINPDSPRIISLVDDMMEIVKKALKTSAQKIQVA